MNINKLEQTHHQQAFMPTIVFGIITFLDDTGTVRLSLIRYILFIWSLCLSPYILLQLNPEKNDTVRTLIGLNGPDQLHLGLPSTLTAPGLHLSSRLGPVSSLNYIIGVLASGLASGWTSDPCPKELLSWIEPLHVCSSLILSLISGLVPFWFWPDLGHMSSSCCAWGWQWNLLPVPDSAHPVQVLGSHRWSTSLAGVIFPSRAACPCCSLRDSNYLTGA